MIFKSNKSAVLSDCGLYRYSLGRVWGPEPMGIVLGINPSTADAMMDDQTVRKLIGFGKQWGWGGFTLLNPFAYRATDQRKLLAVDDPVGPDNDGCMDEVFRSTDKIVCAWGSAKTSAVRELLDARLKVLEPMLKTKRLMCLGTTADGYPRHPLMLSYTTPLQVWNG